MVALVLAAIVIALIGAGLGTAAFIMVSAGAGTVQDGADGAPGADGTDGAVGPSGSPGDPGTTGPKGSSGLAGATGSTGAAGAEGTDGAVGAAGAPGVDADNTFSARFTQVEYSIVIDAVPALVTFPDPATVVTNGTDVVIDADSFTIQTSGYYQVTYGLHPVEFVPAFYTKVDTYIQMDGGGEVSGSQATYSSALPQAEVTTVAHFNAGDQGSVYITVNYNQAGQLWVLPKLIFILIDAD